MRPTSSDGASASPSADLHAAEVKSSKVLSLHGIETPGFDVVALASAMGIIVREGGLENADAWLFRRPDGKGILRTRSGGSSHARRRFSIAHELGHWVMHPDLKQGRYCTETDLTDYVRSPEEAEANCFAATLLMPRFMMKADMGTADPSFALIDRITTEFETSRTATARRFVELTKFPAILVCSVAGKVIWRVKSESAKFYALASQNVPAGSLSAMARANGKSPTELTPISPHIWLKENPVANPQEFFEDFRYNPRADMTLSLLWFI